MGFNSFIPMLLVSFCINKPSFPSDLKCNEFQPEKPVSTPDIWYTSVEEIPKEIPVVESPNLVFPLTCNLTPETSVVVFISTFPPDVKRIFSAFAASNDIYLDALLYKIPPSNPSFWSPKAIWQKPVL